jgi:3-hydroxyisobutyrate dehydrogenase-like beta-hydroxyacid dehydrogenase
MTHVGVVGLGKMGSEIARSLLRHGYQVSVWNRSRPPVDVLAAEGALPEASIEDLVRDVEAVIVMLWGDDAAREVTLGRVMPAARAGQLLIEMSTLSPAMYEVLASAALGRGVDFLAAPVLGSVDAVRQGTLIVLAGGSEKTFERAQPLLASLGKTVTFVGSATASGVLKLSNNTIMGVIAVTMAELLKLCAQAGIDRRLAVESISGAFGRIAGSKTQQLLDRDTDPHFSLDALLKDLLLSREAAATLHVSVPIFDCVLPAVEAAAQSGLGERDYIALALDPAPNREAEAKH